MIKKEKSPNEGIIWKTMLKFTIKFLGQESTITIKTIGNPPKNQKK